MFGLNQKRYTAGPDAPVVDRAPDERVTVPESETPQTALLQRWMSLADMQQRVIASLGNELMRTSNYVQTASETLSERFQRLAVSAQRQTTRINCLTNLAVGVEIDGETVPISEIAALLEGTLADVVMKILLLSKDSMSMVFVLDVLSANIERVEQCNTRIDAINQSMAMLALNARIEAERAGAAGATFRVVASEVRDLSKTTQNLAATMKADLKAITDGIQETHSKLKRVATVDMSENILVKEKLEVLLKALVERTGSLKLIVSEAVTDATDLSEDIDGVITGIQFQDRTKQRLEHVIDTLQMVRQATEEMKANTAATVPELLEVDPLDGAWVKELLARYTMSEMRDRFVAQIFDGQTMDWTDEPEAAVDGSSHGSMELF